MPPKRVYLLDAVGLYFSVFVIGNDDFITGTDSPVSMASLTIADPVSSTKSQGRDLPSGITAMSPGSN